MTQPLYGVDVSHWNGSFDFDEAKGEGFCFAGIKATENTNIVDGQFAANLSKARQEFGNRRVIAYHFQRPGNAAAQAAHIKNVVPKDVTVALDVEDTATNFETSRQIASILKAAGYRVGVYTGHSFWTEHGSPSLSWADFLWAARYPDMSPGYASVEYAGTPSGFWQGFGGFAKADILQFTSVGKVEGQQMDCDAFIGTVAELEELFYGTTDVKEWWEMPIPDADLEKIAKAVWAHELTDPTDKKKKPAATMLSWGYQKIRALYDNKWPAKESK